MVDAKPITKSELANVLKEEGLATKDDILNILAQFYHDRLKPEFDSIQTKLEKLETRIKPTN